MKDDSYLAPNDVELLLHNWEELNASLLQLHYTAVVQLLKAAIVVGVRWDVKNRIYQRYSVLRHRREVELLQKGYLWRID